MINAKKADIKSELAKRFARNQQRKEKTENRSTFQLKESNVDDS